MSLITWNDNLSVGVQSIDKQHGVLVSTLNELHTAMMSGQAGNVTGKLLENLLTYTREHFSTEEAMLAKTAYPGLALHEQMHRELTRKVEGYVARYSHGEITLNLHLLNFLRDWLTNHIQREDKAYGSWVAAHGIQ
ncbi:MAG TPA: bacteriohemerythrin [Terracidiphilus sp.]|jgi:hemerythrin|nr:bacteriohemerythrin [Terracidiphilus sp.]